MQRIEGLSISLDLDTTALNRGLTGLKDKLKTVNSEMKANMSAFDRGDRTVNKYETRLTGLNRKLEVQKEVTKTARTEYEKMVQEYGEGSKEAEKAAREYNNQAAALNNLERYVERTRGELEQLREEQRIAQSGWTRMGETLEATGTRLTKVGDKMKNAGRNMSMYVTAPLVGLGALAMRSSIEFESAFAGVRKTVDATEKQFEDLRTGIIDMSKEIPVAANDIASIAEAAGQLGIKNESILSFSRVMADLGVATNMTSEQAATDLARMANITQMSQKDFDRLGSSIVALGNNFATTESEIVSMSLRLAGQGAQVGMSEAQISALATAMSSVGIEAEAGGTAMSTIMKKIQKAVGEGGKSLGRFAKAADMSSSEFKDAFEKDASAAILALVQGLGKSSEEGKNLTGILEDLGIKGIRESDTLLRLSGASDVLADALDVSTKAWKDNNALTNEAEQRYATTESKIQILKNRFDDIAGTIGDVLKRALVSVAERFDPLLKKVEQGVAWFSKLNQGTQNIILGITAFIAALGPLLVVGGMFVSLLGSAALGLSRLFPAIAQAGGLLKWLRLGFVAMTGPIGITIGILTALGAGFIALYKNSDGFRAGVHELIGKIKELAQNALKALQPAIAAVVKFFKDQLATIQKFWNENKESIMGALNNIYQFVKFIFQNGILPVIKFVMPLILTIIKSVWGNIQGVIKGALNIIMGAIKIFSGLFTGDFKKMWEGVKQLFKGGIEFAWNLFNLLFIGRILKGIGTFVKSFVSFLRGGWNNAIGGIRGFVGKARDWFRSFADDGIARFNQLIDGAKALPGKIGSGIRSMAGKVSDGIKAVANKMAQGLGSGVNGVIGGVNWVLKKVGIKNLIPLWSIPQYATGTDNHPGGPAVVGEKGRELAHVPGVGYTMLGEQGAQFLNLPKGTSVLPNKETESLLSGMFPAYAKGTGWLSDAWNSTKNAAGKIKDKALDVWSYISDPSKLFNKALEVFGVQKPSLPGMLKDIGVGSFNKVKEALKGFLKSKIEDFGSDVPAAGSGVKRWSGVAARALMMTGQYTKSNLDRLLYQMQTESGGNPRAINLWDINAKRGTPSKGLMQVIDPTFRAYAHPGFNKNVYDPLSNILASIRYAVSRYGSLAKAYRGVGYETGGLINQDGLYRLAEGGWPEFVIPTDPARRTDAMKLLALAGKQIGGNKRPNQLPSHGTESDSSLLQAVLEQNKILMSLLQSSRNIESKPVLSEGDIGRAYDRYDARQSGKNAIFKGRAAY